MTTQHHRPGRASFRALGLALSLSAGGAALCEAGGLEGFSGWWRTTLPYALGVAGGLLAMKVWMAPALRSQTDDARRMRVELGELGKAFGIMRQQLLTAVHSTESAALALAERLNAVQTRVQSLQTQANEAVRRSSDLAAESLSSAKVWERTAASLARYLTHYGEMQTECSDRLDHVSERVKSLAPMLTLVSEVAHQTNVLSLNAAIEAARAGENGASFKVVAAEVRRLSSRSAQAAHAITEGVTSAMTSLDTQVAAFAGEGARLTEARGELTTQQDVIDQMNASLSGAAVPLTALSGSMQATAESVLTEIVDAMADLQFQDVTRQLIEQVDQALDGLGRLVEELSTDSDADTGKPSTAAFVANWQSTYVMDAQRHNHARLAPALAHGDGTGMAVEAAAPRVELF